MWIKKEVLLLPTDEKAIVGSIVTRPSDGRAAQVNVLTQDDPQPCIHQHLYVLSDEKIKEGDWFIYDNEILHRDKGEVDSIWNDAIKNGKKIIATTDTALAKTLKSSYVQFGTRVEETRTVQLPQLPQSFIKLFIDEWNLGNPIRQLEVEHEGEWDDHYQAYYADSVSLKVNPDNTIRVRPLGLTNDS